MLKILGKIVSSSEILIILRTVEFTQICFPPQQWMNVFFLFIFFLRSVTHEALMPVATAIYLVVLGFPISLRNGFSFSNKCMFFFVTSIPSLFIHINPPLSLCLSLSHTHTHAHTHMHNIWEDYIYVCTYVCTYVCVCVCVCVYLYRPVVYTFLIPIKFTLEQATNAQRGS
jgi:hypothetical protein